MIYHYCQREKYESSFLAGDIGIRRDLRGFSKAEDKNKLTCL